MSLSIAILSNDLAGSSAPKRLVTKEGIFIDSSERGKGLGSLLLQHARKTAFQLGNKKIYLATDHIGYYEKYGFREIGLSNFEWVRPSKLYEHDTLF
ncbi:GNAT family N-acetyltransferase [Paenibacillus sp. CN-4]|uniref:GNAT family N-acetyltransferase n=1 Tax=Paenibacillus nanchangensis TaxID=3348343 RepID=UPI00397C2ECF